MRFCLSDFVDWTFCTCSILIALQHQVADSTCYFASQLITIACTMKILAGLRVKTRPSKFLSTEKVQTHEHEPHLLTKKISWISHLVWHKHLALRTPFVFVSFLKKYSPFFCHYMWTTVSCCKSRFHKTTAFDTTHCTTTILRTAIYSANEQAKKKENSLLRTGKGSHTFLAF